MMWPPEAKRKIILALAAAAKKPHPANGIPSHSNSAFGQDTRRSRLVPGDYSFRATAADPPRDLAKRQKRARLRPGRNQFPLKREGRGQPGRPQPRAIHYHLL